MLAVALVSSTTGTLQPTTSDTRKLLHGDMNHLHEPLPDPLLLLTTSLLAFVAASLAVATGTGGGGLLVPLYATILKLGPKRAVPVSKATIFGVALGNLAFIANQRHPHAQRPLIDYRLAVLMQGAVLLGVLLGVQLNLLLPEIAVVTLLATVLSVNAYRTLRRGLARWADESARARHAVGPTASACEGDGGGGGGTELTGIAVKPPVAARDRSATPSPTVDDDSVHYGRRRLFDSEPSSTPTSEAALELRRLQLNDSVQAPAWAWGALLGMASVLTLQALAVSGALSPAVNRCKPALYWPLYLAPVPLFGAIVGRVYRELRREDVRRAAVGFAFAEGDMRWSVGSGAMLPAAAVGAGAIAGAVGIGGGMLLGPLLLGLNMEPRVVAATTGFMLLWTGFAGSAAYLAVGKLPWRYFLWFGTLGAVAAQSGQRVVKYLIDRTGRPSIVVLLLGGIILSAVVLMTTIGLVNFGRGLVTGEAVFAFHVENFACNGPGSHGP